MEYSSRAMERKKAAAGEEIRRRAAELQTRSLIRDREENKEPEEEEIYVPVFLKALNPVDQLGKKLVLELIGIIPVSALLLMFLIVFVLCVAVLVDTNERETETGEMLRLRITSETGEVFINEPLTDDEMLAAFLASGAEGERMNTIAFVLSKVGYPYSQPLRASGKAYDCSSLVYYAYLNEGIDLSVGAGYPPTAAEEARTLEYAGCTVDLKTDDLKAGDLIFYSKKANGRYKGIYHVAMYIGNGLSVEAYSEKCGVVLQNVRTENAVLVMRPY